MNHSDDADKKESKPPVRAPKNSLKDIGMFLDLTFPDLLHRETASSSEIVADNPAKE